MTTDLPTVPPVVGGIYKRRNGKKTNPLYEEDGEWYDDDAELVSEGGVWLSDGRAWCENPEYDLVELITMAVPIAEFQQLKRAQAAMEEQEANRSPPSGRISWKKHQEWLSHQPKKADR